MEAVRGRITRAPSGGLRRVIGRSLRIVVNDYASYLLQRPHAHDETSVSIVVTGGVEESVRRGRVVVGPGCVVVKPAGTVHEDQFAGGGSQLVALVLDPASSRGARYGWHRTRDVASAGFAVYRALREEADAGGLSWDVEDATFELLAALAEPAPSTTARPPWLRRVEETIRERTRISVADLAASADVHPVHLARVFRRFHRSTVTEYAHRVRVERACTALMTKEVGVASIAADAGFADQAHFTRVFHARMGLTPAAYRALVRPRRRHVRFVQAH
jgi:AraC family transcriptional regulator